jgi:hypothetical protein
VSSSSAYERPRTAVVNALGAEHQRLPVLILGDAYAPPEDAQSADGQRFVHGTRRILALLAERHGFFKLH